MEIKYNLGLEHLVGSGVEPGTTMNHSTPGLDLTVDLC